MKSTATSVSRNHNVKCVPAKKGEKTTFSSSLNTNDNVSKQQLNKSVDI